MSKYDFGRFPKHEHIVQWCNHLDLANKGDWNDYEIEFFNNVSSLLKRGVKLTEKQVYFLETMYSKYTD